MSPFPTLAVSNSVDAGQWAGATDHDGSVELTGGTKGSAALKAMIFCRDPVGAEELVAALKVRWPDIDSLVASRGKRDLETVVRHEPDLVVVRGDLPTLDIWSATREVRLVSDVPIVVVSESNDPMDTVRALDLGADDYMSMPRDPRVLVARVVAVLRRVGLAGLETETSIIRCGELVMHRRDQVVFLGSERLLLTKTEFNLLSLLVESPLVTLSGEYIQRVLWGDQSETADRLKKYIQRLRQKLADDAREPHWIRTVHGIGYCFLAPQTSVAGVD